MIKSFKIRLFPTPGQEALFWKHIGSCRFIWNHMLAKQEEQFQSGGKHLSHFDMIQQITNLKSQDDYKWLYEISHSSLQIICGDLHKAYQRFFKKQARHPKFKSRKKAKPNFPLRQDKGCVYFKDGYVHIPKVGKVKFKTNYKLPERRNVKLTNPRISYIKANHKWILSFGMELESQEHMLSDTPMGIDLGIKELAVVAFGEESLVFHNINRSRRVRTLESKKKYINRRISKKYEVWNAAHPNDKWHKSKAIEKYERTLRQIYYKLANIRLNYIHQTTHKLTSLCPRSVTMEDLNVKGMMKDKLVSKLVADQCFYEFIRQMKYKCEWSGIEFRQADRLYASSRICSCCGAIKDDLKRSDRRYKCIRCGFEIDRDLNAARNLMTYGM